MPTFYMDPFAPDAGDAMDGGGVLPEIANPGELPYGVLDGEGSSAPSNRFGEFLKIGGMFSNAFGANDPLSTSNQLGNQLAYNLGQSALTSSLAAQGLGIRGQLMGVGASLLGEDAALARETTAALRAQQLNNTNASREAGSRGLKAQLAGRMNPQAIMQTSARIYGV